MLIDQDGALRPIKDGLLHDGADLNEDDEGIEKATEKDADAETSEEERELTGQKRPRKGAGWWGRGRPLQPHRKGKAKNFVDGAGTPSPGTWRIEDRRLPENEVAEELRAALRQGLEEGFVLPSSWRIDGLPISGGRGLRVDGQLEEDLEAPRFRRRQIPGGRRRAVDRRSVDAGLDDCLRGP